MKVINLFAGPGSGKSTTCAGVFSKLKLAGVNCEMALEYAKDKVWEQSFHTLDNQIYIFGKQLHRLWRLKELFKMVGISNEIFGITGISQTRYRGFEIQNYLDAQKNVLSYCILDDDCDMLPTQLDNFIQTDFRVGLTEDNVNKAIKILNRYDEH